MKAEVDYMYHPGDVVRVREDLAENTNYKMCSGKNNGADCWIWGWMKEYAGKQITIKRIDGNGFYEAAIIEDCIWSDEMFEPLNECLCSSLL